MGSERRETWPYEHNMVVVPTNPQCQGVACIGHVKVNISHKSEGIHGAPSHPGGTNDN